MSSFRFSSVMNRDNKIWSIIVAVQHQKGNKTLLLKLWIIS